MVEVLILVIIVATANSAHTTWLSMRRRLVRFIPFTSLRLVSWVFA